MSLFAETKSDSTCLKQATLYCDGGSRGNPGPAAAGWNLGWTGTADVIDQGGEYLGHKTNNYAEYTSLIRGMEIALKNGANAIRIKMDSKLAVEQLSGRWKVKHPEIKLLWQQACALKDQFMKFEIEHIPREQNKVADAMVNRVLDKQKV